MAQKKVIANNSEQAKKRFASAPVSHAVGRRKCASARVWIRRGSGKIVVNGLDHAQYFDTDFMRNMAAFPCFVVPTATTYDYQVTVVGGGKMGQANAVKLSIARALVSLDEAHRPLLRTHKLLTVDDRITERKKYGQRGARRKFQFVKR